VKANPELKLDQARKAVRDCACFNLRRASRAVTLIYDDALAHLGLSSGQYVLLLAVRLKGETSLLQLADMVWTDRSVLSRTVRPLEERGLLKIVPGSDRRIRKVTLSPAGHRALLTAHASWQRAQMRITRLVGAPRLERLLGTIDQTLRKMQPKKKRPSGRALKFVPALRRRAA
jgi:DNA-binding MarR family transcriptional regulator